MAFSDVISRCTSKWCAEGLTLAPPIPETEVRRVWDGLHRELSEDVLHLYTSVGGFQEYAFDNEFSWCLWPWDWLRKQNAETHRTGVMFCDHSMEVVTWELRYENRQHSSVWSSDGDQTAPTLELFFERYLENAWQLL